MVIVAMKYSPKIPLAVQASSAKPARRGNGRRAVPPNLGCAYVRFESGLS
jgi:hypothetical protein